MNFYRITFSLFSLFVCLFVFQCRAQVIFSCHSQLWKSNKVNFAEKKKQQQHVCQRTWYNTAHKYGRFKVSWSRFISVF